MTGTASKIDERMSHQPSASKAETKPMALTIPNISGAAQMREVLSLEFK